MLYPVRFGRVLFAFLPFLLAFARDRHRFVVVGRSREVSDERRRERASELRDVMLELGPTFIKIGQVLSTRPDLVPKIYAEEFRTLQDAVPPGAYEEVEPILSEDVADGGQVSDVYEEFDTEPIAGGSLAQVHTARYGGRRVAVKIRRPGIVEVVETDLRVIRRVLPLITAFAPERHRFSLRNLADDFERVIREELDFEREGRMMDEIRQNFEADDSVTIPRWYPERSTERVLTMTYVGSTKLSAVERLRERGFDPKEVAHDVANAYFEMGMVHGVFHGDPHPGNIGVDERGRIVFYDFGMSGRFTPEMRESIVQFYLAVVSRDVNRIMDVLVALGTLDPDVDRQAMAHVLQLVLEDLEGSGVSDWRAILAEVLTVLRAFPFRIPPDLMLVIRVATVGEGVLRDLDPEFDIVTTAREFLLEHGYMRQGVGTLVEETRRDARTSFQSTVRLPSKLEDVLDLLLRGDLSVSGLELERPLVVVGRTLAYALITAAWVIGSSILIYENPVYGAIGFTIAAVMTVLFVQSILKTRRTAR
ncbi:ABC1 kinase family protein [Halorussus halophilus]|uniref:ABC1 kinase family protein n=1 Tax=Halorussus halophilus TaxID=2650975 RepID=UPI00130121F2|nr:AarF/ABC1/UbiB kinase family protein [Halorussus halophilus]